jgi:hypothetical protein
VGIARVEMVKGLRRSHGNGIGALRYAQNGSKGLAVARRIHSARLVLDDPRGNCHRRLHATDQRTILE